MDSVRTAIMDAGVVGNGSLVDAVELDPAEIRGFAGGANDLPAAGPVRDVYVDDD